MYLYLHIIHWTSKIITFTTWSVKNTWEWQPAHKLTILSDTLYYFSPYPYNNNTYLNKNPFKTLIHSHRTEFDTKVSQFKPWAFTLNLCLFLRCVMLRQLDHEQVEEPIGYDVNVFVTTLKDWEHRCRLLGVVKYVHCFCCAWNLGADILCFNWYKDT